MIIYEFGIIKICREIYIRQFGNFIETRGTAASRCNILIIKVNLKSIIRMVVLSAPTRPEGSR